MTGGAVFVDTGGLVALINNRDQLHAQARSLMAELDRSQLLMVTSEWVLTELLATTSAPPLRTGAAKVVRSVLASRYYRVLESSHADWQRAFELYGERPDKEWSLVDCASMISCQELGIKRVLTGDHHFAQAGFEVLLK